MQFTEREAAVPGVEFQLTANLTATINGPESRDSASLRIFDSRTQRTRVFELGDSHATGVWPVTYWRAQGVVCFTRSERVVFARLSTGRTVEHDTDDGYIGHTHTAPGGLLLVAGMTSLFAFTKPGAPVWNAPQLATDGCQVLACNRTTAFVCGFDPGHMVEYHWRVSLKTGKTGPMSPSEKRRFAYKAASSS